MLIEADTEKKQCQNDTFQLYRGDCYCYRNKRLHTYEITYQFSVVKNNLNLNRLFQKTTIIKTQILHLIDEYSDLGNRKSTRLTLTKVKANWLLSKQADL